MTDVTLRQLEYAVAVADQAHFGRAAEKTNVTQPGLSGQIQTLEHKLGVVLFERGHRGASLTPAGEEVIARARLVLAEVAGLVTAASVHDGDLTGILRVAAIPTVAPYLLPGLVKVFRTRWPGLSLHLSELKTTDMVTAIENGRLDLGLLATPIDTGSLRVSEVCDEAFYLAVPTDHELAGREIVPVSVLSGLPVLILEEGHCLREHAKAACELAGATEQSEVHSASLSTLTQMVVAGVGVTLLPSSAVSVEARDGNHIATVAFEDPAPGRTVSLVWRGSDPRAAHLAKSVEPLAKAFGQSGVF